MTLIVDACNTAHKKIIVPFIDMILGYTISKKLSVFIAGSFFLYFDKINGEQWITIASIYVGVQGIIDIAKEIKIPRNNNTLK